MKHGHFVLTSGAIILDGCNSTCSRPRGLLSPMASRRWSFSAHEISCYTTTRRRRGYRIRLTHSHAVLIGVPVLTDVATNAAEGDDVVLVGVVLGTEAPDDGKAPAVVKGGAQLPKLPSELGRQREVVWRDQGNVFHRNGCKHEEWKTGQL